MSVQYCKRCVMHSGIPNVNLNEDGICNYCELHDTWNQQYPTNREGEKLLHKILEKVREDGKDKEFDCIMGVSGGCARARATGYSRKRREPLTP